jgi:hypothetical protein
MAEDGEGADSGTVLLLDAFVEDSGEKLEIGLLAGGYGGWGGLDQFLPSLLGEGDRAKRGGGVILTPLFPSTTTLRAAVPLPETSSGRNSIACLPEPP